jgi:hypothetical protein
MILPLSRSPLLTFLRREHTVTTFPWARRSSILRQLELLRHHLRNPFLSPTKRDSVTIGDFIHPDVVKLKQ